MNFAFKSIFVLLDVLPRDLEPYIFVSSNVQDRATHNIKGESESAFTMWMRTLINLMLARSSMTTLASLRLVCNCDCCQSLSTYIILLSTRIVEALWLSVLSDMLIGSEMMFRNILTK